MTDRKILDGQYMSPDFGYFYVRDNKAYCEDGDILDLEDEHGTCFRFVPTEFVEDYSKWSDMKRESVLKEYAKERRDAERKAAKERAARLRVVKRANKKLTTEEFDAVCEWAITGDRYGTEEQGDI